MKVILVIDAPKDYETCKGYSEKCFGSSYGEYYCLLKNGEIGCPLKPIPQEKDDFINEDYTKEEELEYHYNSGWNDCINQILGEEE